MPLAADRRGPLDRVADGQHVHAVDGLGVHVVLGEAGRAAGQVVDAHHFLVGPMGHPVVVVDDQVDDRQAGCARPGQVVGPLVLGGPVERLEDDPVGVGAVSGEAADDLVGAAVAERHRRARRDRHAAADDRVRAQMAGREVADVHAAATSPAVAFFLAEQLGDGLVDVLLERVGEQTFAGRCLRPGRAGPQGILRHRPDRGEALGDCVAVAAVRAGDVVVGAKGAAGADGRRLLADRNVGRAAVVVARQRVVAARAEADDHLLQLADGQHVVEQIERRRGGDPPRGDLGAGVAGEVEAADRAQGLLERRKIGSSVAPVSRLRDHALHLWL